jgi:hypothetical protein
MVKTEWPVLSVPLPLFSPLVFVPVELYPSRTASLAEM